MALSQRSRTVLTLYSASDCVHCHRVRLVLAAKGVVYDLVRGQSALATGRSARSESRTTRVPTLVDRDLVLYDTSVICEYLDERYPHPPLMPVDPLVARAPAPGDDACRARLAALQLRRSRAGGRPAETARKRLREALLSSIALFKAAKFFLNPELSLADCALSPLIWRLPSLNVVLPREAHADQRIWRPHFPQPRIHAQPDAGRKSAAALTLQHAAMTATISMSSNRPYLLRAMYDWISDNGLTPYILVDAAAPGVRRAQECGQGRARGAQRRRARGGAAGPGQGLRAFHGAFFRRQPDGRSADERHTGASTRRKTVRA